MSEDTRPRGSQTARESSRPGELGGGFSKGTSEKQLSGSPTHHSTPKSGLVIGHRRNMLASMPAPLMDRSPQLERKGGSAMQLMASRVS
eukprot:CAMPEP_0119139980 /NCGR_PEP_ID=MMETSP1310-20130426/28460_1 /TAXON_ID=464262 /ORGANISM="Genus nov. species nov., Strain RCC2339" /LENGTH=88 /DNA_ID=CAMNT_0007131307 /DNA_START=44 /DNA_END=306 /DNA_ORIENTATION=+